MKWPTKALMAHPDSFDVEYAINPHMRDDEGNLNKVNKEKALLQWESLKNTFESLNIKVDVLPAVKGLPDMVFTANQTLPFLKSENSIENENENKENKTQIILSQMFSSKRQDEVQYFSKWAQKNNIEIYTYKTQGSFEGMGDALWNYETGEIYGGSGFRTSDEVYDEIEKIIERKIYRLKLVNEKFYHLDTCLAIVNKDIAFVVKEGFDASSFEFLKTKFMHLIEIPLNEAVNGFAGNMCAVNGTDIIIQVGNAYTVSKAKALKIKVHEVDTSEYIKSGGSVFCMKQLYW